MTTDGVVLGVDVGGTGIKARVTDAAGLSLGDLRVPTPQDDPQARQLAEVVADLVVSAVRTSGTGPDHGLDAVGLVVPGVVHEASGTSVRSVNLGWRDVPVRDRVRQALERRGIAVPIAFGHDVRAGALAEVRGSGSESLQRGSVGFVPVGTGLASALVVDGVVVDGGGWAGEVGQVRIAAGPHAGARTEEIASAGAVARRLGVPTALQAVARVRAGDPAAVRVWHECVDVLADAIAWMTAVAGCHTVVVGGGLAESGPLLFGPLRTALTDRMPGLRHPVLVPARHRDGAGALGAALLAQDLLAALTTTGQRA